MKLVCQLNWKEKEKIDDCGRRRYQFAESTHCSTHETALLISMIFEKHFHDVLLLNKKETSWNFKQKDLLVTKISPKQQTCLPQAKCSFNSNVWVNVLSKDFQRISSPKVYIPKNILELFDQSVYLKIVSYINPIFVNISIIVLNFECPFESFALVNMSKLV